MKKKLFVLPVLFLLQLIALKTTAQQFIPKPAEPAICKTAVAGYQLGGTIEFSPQLGCVPVGSTQIAVKIESVPDPNKSNLLVDAPVIFANVGAPGFDINTATPVSMTGNKLTIPLDPGYYWMAVSGTKGGVKYYGCRLYEALSTQAPKVISSSCTGNTIELSIPKDDLNKFDTYEITWDTGVKDNINVTGKTFPIKLQKTYTALPPRIQITGSYERTGFSGLCLSAVTEIKPNGVEPPFITYLEGENYGKEASLKFIQYANNTNYDLLAKIDNANPSEPFVKLTDAKNGQVKVTGLDATKKYCFKLGITNGCGNTVYSQNTVCNIVVRSFLKSTKEVDLSWNLPLTPTGIPSDLKLREVVIPCPACTPNNITLPSKTATARTISTLDCAKTYEYYVNATFPPVPVAGLTTSWSVNVISAHLAVDPKANALSLKPSSIAQVDYDYADDSKIKITVFEESASSNFNSKYTFFRAENNSTSFIKIGTAVTASFDDVALVVGEPKSYCYKYQKQDECGITSELSDPFCTILLTNKKQNLLEWTPYLVPPTLVTSSKPAEYTITYFDGQFGAWVPDITTKNLGATIEAIMKSQDTDKVKFKIRAKQFVTANAFPTGQFLNSSSNIVEVLNPPRLFVPTVFTPNGTGPAETESFLINSKFIASGSIKVFDRWGGSIFEGDINSGWDGMEGTKNSPAPTGTYPYVIKAISSEGKEINMKGTVLLLR
jgi:gliding motility-associated-like protein